MSEVGTHRIVSHTKWLEARKELMAREKELTHLRDQLAARRRALPWEPVEKSYEFEGPKGKETLADLFSARSQLLVYHFMFPESWAEGCKSCSFWADGYDRMAPHLAARDVSLVAVSKASFPKLDAYKRRLGWTFHWVSSAGGDFNRDFGVSLTPQEVTEKSRVYNYGTMSHPTEEAPGVSVFAKLPSGEIFHTYSAYARGLDAMNPGYQLLDLVPKGRDEGSLEFTMGWVRHRDRY